MKSLKKKRFRYTIILFLFCLLACQIWNHFTKAPYMGSDSVLVQSGVRMKPNPIHTYMTNFNITLQNVTLNAAEGLTLSKGYDAYLINCTTQDNITITISDWFLYDAYETRFRPNTEDDATCSFTVNIRSRENPHVSGASSWSYNEATDIITLTCANYSLVEITFKGAATEQIEWILEQTPMWLGISGIFCLILCPTAFVFFAKSDNLESAFIWSLGLLVLGMGLVIGWLW